MWQSARNNTPRGGLPAPVPCSQRLAPKLRRGASSAAVLFYHLVALCLDNAAKK